MRLKLIALASVVALVLPTLALAAYNDVTLTTDAVISVGGYTLNVSGSSAVIESIVVDTGSFSVTLGSGSAITISSPTLQQLSSDVTSDVVSNPCTGSESSISLAYSGAGTVTNVITTSATVCSGSGSTPAPSGGGGGSGAISFPGYQVANSATTTSNAKIGGLTETQIQSILSLLASFGADQATINNINNVLHGQAVVPLSSSPTVVFTRNRELNDTGQDVRALQVWLNAHGFTVAATGPGSPGNETSLFGSKTYQALIKFQQSKNLPQTGYFGPLTRAALASMSATSITQ